MSTSSSHKRVWTQEDVADLARRALDPSRLDHDGRNEFALYLGELCLNRLRAMKVPNHELADYMQDAIMNVFKYSARKIRWEDDLRRYFFRVVCNVVYAANRKRRSQPKTCELVPVANLEWEEECARAEAIEAIHEAVGKLAPRKRLVITRIFLDGESARGAAASLGIGRDLVAKLRDEGLEELSKRMKGTLGPGGLDGR